MKHSIFKDGYKKVCEAEVVYTTAVRASYYLMEKDELINLIDVMGGLIISAHDNFDEPQNSGQKEVVSSH